MKTHTGYFQNYKECVFSDPSSQKNMCLSHTRTQKKTSFLQEECEITMFQDWGGGSWAPSGQKSLCTRTTSGKAMTPEFMNALRKSVFHLF